MSFTRLGLCISYVARFTPNQRSLKLGNNQFGSPYFMNTGCVSNQVGNLFPTRPTNVTGCVWIFMTLSNQLFTTRSWLIIAILTCHRNTLWNDQVQAAHLIVNGYKPTTTGISQQQPSWIVVRPLDLLFTLRCWAIPRSSDIQWFVFQWTKDQHGSSVPHVIQIWFYTISGIPFSDIGQETTPIKMTNSWNLA